MDFTRGKKPVLQGVIKLLRYKFCNKPFCFDFIRGYKLFLIMYYKATEIQIYHLTF